MDFNSKCSCKGNNLDRLVQPMILTVLIKGDASGYIILNKVAHLPMMKGVKPDPTGIYRQLKFMEQKGNIESYEPIEGTSKAKRTYRITEQGKRCFYNWIETLTEYRNSIDLFIEEMKKI